MGNRWRDMTDEDKAPYIEMSAEDRKRYEAEMAQYGGEDTAERGRHPRKRGEQQKGSKPRKNLSVFFIFAADCRTSLKHMSITESQKECGARWAAMSSEEKAPYEE